MDPTVVILLSDKRSGSTMVEEEICRHPDVQHVGYTPHTYSETQYWLKGARLLGMPPQAFYGHRYYPGLSNRVAVRTMLQDVVTGNVPGFEAPAEDSELVFEGWEALCERYARPVFFEKSPHHLAHWACLASILQWMERTRFRVRILGLVRNPLAVQYSAFELFGTAPEDRQFAWAEMYRDLLAFSQMVPAEVFHLVRYEDLTAQPEEVLQGVYDFVGLPPLEVSRPTVHRRSLQRWIEDPDFRVRLHESVKQVARHFGYRDEELDNPEKPLPPLLRRIGRGGRQLVRRGIGAVGRTVVEPLRAALRGRSRED